MNDDPMLQLVALLSQIYGDEVRDAYLPKIKQLIAERPIPPRTYPSSQKDVVLITYGDSLTHPDEAPLQTLPIPRTTAFRLAITWR